jgi:hypothetical protein
LVGGGDTLAGGGCPRLSYAGRLQVNRAMAAQAALLVSLDSTSVGMLFLIII